MACSSEETVTPEIQGPGTGTHMRNAWSHFEAGDYEEALGFFDQALGVDAESSEAHLGRGWSLLKTASTSASLTAASNAFDQALLLDPASRDALGGRAAARLSLGGAGVAGAVEDAEALLAQDPDFEFLHDPKFNHVAQRLIQAQAHASLGSFDSALLALDTVFVSGITADESESWVVEGLIEASFGAAVLAHLDRVERLWRGGLL